MNKFLDAVTLALSSIWANKLRSFMMVLGNVVAVTSIIAVVSLIQGMNGYVADSIVQEVGVGTFQVARVGVITNEEEEQEARRRNPDVTMVDLRAIKASSESIDAVMAQSNAQANITFRSETLENVGVRGVSADYDQFGGYEAERGRTISRIEIQRSRPLAYLGVETAEKLFKGRNPVEQTIMVNGIHFRVVGVNERKGALFGNSQDDFVLIPLGAFQKMFGSRRSFEITVKPRDPSLVPQAMEEARIALRTSRKLRPRDKDNFGLVTSDTFMELWQSFSQGAFAVLIGIVSLSLVVGGIVIMNIMLMVVSERTREIGLRKALGARRRDIVWQVLTESTTLSIVGGMVGTVLGFIVAALVAYFSPIPAKIELWAVVMGIGMTAGVGLFFGLYPAMRASKLDPIEALRRE